MREILIDFCESIRKYEHESGHAISINKDDRETEEFVNTFLQSFNDDKYYCPDCKVYKRSNP